MAVTSQTRSRMAVATAVLVGTVVGLCGFNLVTAIGCQPTDVTNKVTIGQATWVCITFNNVTRALFSPTADSFTRITIPGSYISSPVNTGYIQLGLNSGWSSNLTSTDPDAQYIISVDVSSLGGLSLFPKVYQKFNKKPSPVNWEVITVPILTAIVVVNQGVVQFITWDDGCFFCLPGSSACIGNTYDVTNGAIFGGSSFVGCAQEQVACNPTNGTASNCDLNVYLTWTGTDANGNYFTSAGVRFSRFRSFGAESLYNDALSDANLGITTASSTYGNIENKFNEIKNGVGA